MSSYRDVRGDEGDGDRDYDGGSNGKGKGKGKGKKGDMWPGDWNCRNCGTHNFARNVRCITCSADKSGEKKPEESRSRSRGNRNYGDHDDGSIARHPKGGGKGKSDWKGESKGKFISKSDVSELTEAKIWVGGLPQDVGDRELSKLFSKCGDVDEVSIKHSARDTFAFVSFKDIRDARDAIKQFDQAIVLGGHRIKVAAASRTIGPKGKGKDRSRSRSRRRSPSRRSSRRSPRRSPPRRSPPRRSPPRRSPHRRSPPRKSRSISRRRPSPPRRRSRSRRDRSRTPEIVRVNLWQLPPDMEDEELFEIASSFGRVLKHDIWTEPDAPCNQKYGWVEYGTMKEARQCLRELDDRRMDDWSMRLKANFASKR